MSVTFIDPPGPLTNTTEPIDFTTSRLVTSISVEFNPTTAQGSRETVWDGPDGDGAGDFSYAYRLSSRTGSGPYTWSVRRSTVWPADFRIRVQELEEPPVPVTGGFSLLYAVDFSTLTNQTLAPGANTLSDGQRWWFKGTFGETNEDLMIVNGSGMRSRMRTTAPQGHGVGNLPACMMLDFSDLAGYDPEAPLLIQARFEVVDLTYPSNVRPEISLVTAVGDASAVTNAQRTGLTASMYDKNGGAWRYMFDTVGFSGTQTTTGQAGAVNLNVFSILDTKALKANLGGVSAVMASATVWPALTDPPTHTTSAWRLGYPTGAPYPNQGVAFWVTNGVGPAFGLVTNTLRALRVYQTGA